MKNWHYNIKSALIMSLLYFYYPILNMLNQEKHYEQLKKYNRGKRVGIVGFFPDMNIGNNLLKYSMFIFLKKLGFKPILISLKTNCNIYFLRNNLIIKEITNYSELNKSDYDILMVNSDQSWSYSFKGILEVGFLSFAKNWNVSKFVYAASLGYDSWNVSNKTINSAKELVKQFSGISVRENSSIGIIKKYLGVEPVLAIDPTLLLKKSDYLKIIENYKSKIDIKKNYMCVYILDNSKVLNNFIEKASQALNYNILNITPYENNYIENFIYSLNHCNSMITDSYHGTIFSIIFVKPFITFINTDRGNARFFSLNQTFSLNNRIIYPRQFEKEDIYILRSIPNINISNFKYLKDKSINFLKMNLEMFFD